MNNYTQDYLNNIISKMTPDEFLKLNPMLSYAVGILIKACKETTAGYCALRDWDEVRGKNTTHG